MKNNLNSSSDVKDIKNIKVWNYDACYTEAKKYSSRGEFAKKCQSAYNSARRNGWLDNYTWFQKLTGFWNQDTCCEEAKKYSSRSEFERCANGAWAVANKNGWINDYTWLKRPESEKKKWNYETCFEEAKKYKSLTEFFRGSEGAYNVATRNKWTKEYTWFKRPEPVNKKWNHETCYYEAKKYTSKVGFKNGCPSAYTAARTNGWLGEYVWFENLAFKWDYVSCINEAKKYKTIQSFRKNCKTAASVVRKKGWLDEIKLLFSEYIDPLTIEGYLVYAYIDYETRTVYVGLTRDFDGRKRSHRYPVNEFGDYDTVATYFISIGKEIPEPIILIGNLNGLQAGHFENWYRECYTNFGWNVLNIGPTGAGISSLGGGYKKWDYEKCYNLAKLCKMKSEMRARSTQAFYTAKKNGWLDAYTWFEHPRKDMGYWDYEHCYEEAKKYETKKRFQEGCNTAYNVAFRKGWLKDYTWFVNGRVKWTYDKCYELAKTCRTNKEFEKKSSSACHMARKQGWLNDYTWFLSNHDARSIGNKEQWARRKALV